MDIEQQIQWKFHKRLPKVASEKGECKKETREDAVMLDYFLVSDTKPYNKATALPNDI